MWEVVKSVVFPFGTPPTLPFIINVTLYRTHASAERV
jgi:hypothetical protein